jgi:membrane protein
VALLWLWILNMSLLFGAEFDAEVERGRELQAGIKAEETIQLPPRDTKKSEKLQQQMDEDIKHGRELRERLSQDTTDGQSPGERHRDKIREQVRTHSENGQSEGGDRGKGSA